MAREPNMILALGSFLLFAPVMICSAAPQDPQAVNLLRQSLIALNPAGSQIRDVTLTGTVRRIAGSDDETGTAVLRALATGEARTDLTFQSGQRSEIVANSDRGPVGNWSGPDGSPKPIALFNLLVDSAWFSPAILLSKAGSSPNVILSSFGSETRDGLAVQHLRTSKQFAAAPAKLAVLMQRHSQIEVYLDASTLLPTAISFDAHPANNAGIDIPVEIRFSDYRLASGIRAPFHVQRYFNGGLVLDLQVENAALNTGLSPSDFNMAYQTTMPVYRTTH